VIVLACAAVVGHWSAMTPSSCVVFPKKLAGLTIIMTAFTIEESRDCIIFLDHTGGRNEVDCVCGVCESTEE
jgi:hypothetical protein